MKKFTINTLLLAVMLLAAVAVYTVKDEPVERFEISPNPMERECTISLSFRNPLSISLQIQTQTGDLVQDLFSGPAGKDMVFTWDRIDQENQYVPNGTYVVVLGYDTRYTSTKKTLILK